MWKRPAVFVPVAAALFIAVPSAGLSLLMGILNGATDGGRAGQGTDLCGVRLSGFWAAYQNNVWVFELGTAALIGGLVLLLLMFARRGNALAVTVIAALILIPAAGPWIAQYDRHGESSPRIFECHGL